ncbi:2946_t:CDS:1, partial [Racocetra persica]
FIIIHIISADSTIESTVLSTIIVSPSSSITIISTASLTKFVSINCTAASAAKNL